MSKRFDLIVLGGGLAGLTLTLQLKKEFPNLSILVLEKRQHPAPEAAFKVGESSVEIGAHYFNHVLGLSQHLRDGQLPKLGLRFFFPAGENADIAQRFELGGSDFLPVRSFQLDRGIFENHIREQIVEHGAIFVDEARVSSVSLSASDADHQVTYTRQGIEDQATARWVVDASGRGSILKQQLGLAQKNAHDVSAVWFRVKKKINIDTWADAAGWMERNNGSRYLSTNHLMGAGYWVWVIPLSSGSTSVGIVADESIHPLRSYNSFEKSLVWLRQYEPQCAEAVVAALDEGPEMLQDFLALKHFSHSCKQVFSANRWCLTGEAGVFIDPFYSPGSDFIGISNTFITELIRRDLQGESIVGVTPVFDQIYLSLFENTMTLYQGCYPMWGNQVVMPLKVIWDYAYYWGVLALLFFSKRLCELGAYVRIRADIEKIRRLNSEVQNFFIRWNQEEQPTPHPGFLDMTKVPLLYQLNAALRDELDTEGVAARMRENIGLLERLAAEIFAWREDRQSNLSAGLLTETFDILEPSPQ